MLLRDCWYVLEAFITLSQIICEYLCSSSCNSFAPRSRSAPRRRKRGGLCDFSQGTLARRSNQRLFPAKLYIASDGMLYHLQLGRSSRESILRRSISQDIPGTTLGYTQQGIVNISPMPGH